MSSEQPRTASRAILTDAEKRVLLVKRGPGQSSEEWCFPGGKPEMITDSGEYESSEQTIHRESLEELGRDFDFVFWGTSLSTNPVTGQIWKTSLFVGEMDDEVEAIVLNHENTEVRMFHLSELGSIAIAFEHREILEIFSQSESQRGTHHTSWLRVYPSDEVFRETG